FLAMLSHELRNPLAPIMTAVYLLRELLTSEQPVVREARDMIDRQATRMKRLVDDLLDVSRMALHRVEWRGRAVDLGEVVAWAIESVRSMVDERRRELTVATDPEGILLTADPLRLEQAIAALLANAAKFTDPGGRIDVRIGREDGQAVVRVR